MTKMVIPGRETARDFRTALGRYPTGVTIVTAPSEIGPLGITANSFASVSLDPPLILWAPAKFSRRYKTFAEARHFAVHVAGVDQEDLCHRFSRDGTAFDGTDWQLGAQGVPLLNDFLARFECETVATHDGGDHRIVVARVVQARWREGAPLVFNQGRYAGVSTDPDR